MILLSGHPSFKKGGETFTPKNPLVDGYALLRGRLYGAKIMERIHFYKQYTSRLGGRVCLY